MKRNEIICIALVSLLSGEALALTGVNPTGVNVRSSGPTSVFITFQGTAGQTSTEAFWCGEITVPAATVTSFNPCVPGTDFGHLRISNDLSQASGIGGVANLSDVMTIPTSVATRAFQAAKAGSASSFFYVRKFVNSVGAAEFIAVTCRMAGSGARIPLALMDVRPIFRTDKGDQPVYVVQKGEELPPMGAIIYYNGSGRLKGRWEIVKPGDPEPTAKDLLSEASLPIEQRALQRRYLELKRIDQFLPPTGRIFLPGPPPERLPTGANGPYKILLRIEATRDKEADSNTTTGVVSSGGVAGFSMPVLRYYVGSKAEQARVSAGLVRGRLSLVSPEVDAVMDPAYPAQFSWVDAIGSILYRLEVEGSEGTVFSALVKAGVSSYTAPPWIRDHMEEDLRWRVMGLDNKGRVVAKSEWRELQAP